MQAVAHTVLKKCEKANKENPQAHMESDSRHVRTIKNVRCLFDGGNANRKLIKL